MGSLQDDDILLEKEFQVKNHDFYEYFLVSLTSQKRKHFSLCYCILNLLIV